MTLTPVQEGEEDGPHMRRCSRCNRVFSSLQGVSQHIQTIHKGKGFRVSAHRPEREESLADIAVEAHIKRAMGEPLDPLEESLLP